MQKGTIKFFNDVKGFGFIVPAVGGKEVFVHATGIVDGDKLKQGDEVVFDTEQGNKGIVAVNVQLA
jgi:CspA family cold shock protein